MDARRSGAGGTHGDEGPEAAPAAIGARTAHGFMWTAARALVIRGLSLVSFTVLARLLDPEDYGIAALATVFTSLLAVITTAGLSQALVQRPTVDRTDLDTAFWTSFALGVILGIALALAAWPLADAFGEPLLRPVLQVLAVVFVFAGMGSSHQAVLQRSLQFDRIARAGMIANLVATAVGVTFAFLGFGVWALVVQSVLGPVGTSLGVMAQSHFTPGFAVSGERFREMFRFSRSVVGTQLSAFLNQRSDDFLIGGFMGTVSLGIYSVAYRVLIVMQDVLITSVQGVIFPAFSRIQADRERLARAYMSASRMGALVAFPGYVFVLVAAPELIDVVFGHKWHESVPIMQVLCLVGPLMAVMQFNFAVLTSIGRPDTVFRLTAAGAVLQVAAFAIAVNFGLVWVAAALVLRLTLMLPVGLLLASRALDSSLLQYVRELGPVALATAILGGALAGLRALVVGHVPDVVVILILAAAAAPVFFGAFRLLSARQFDEARAYVAGVVRARRGERRLTPAIS